MEQSIPLSYHHNCRTKLADSPKKVLWWSVELCKLRENTRRLFNKDKKTGDWDSYRNALVRYNIAIRKAKRQSWRKYCQRTNQISSGARLMKVLKSDARNKTGTLKQANGSFNMTGQKTQSFTRLIFLIQKKSITVRRGRCNQTWNPTG